MSTVGYNAYYTLPYSDTQWKIDMAQLDLGERLAVERALNDPTSSEFWNVLQVVQKNNPDAFQVIQNGSGPLLAPALSDAWYFDPASVDIHFLIGLVVELMIDIGSSMSKQAMASARASIAEYSQLADKRLQEELAAAKAEFTAAIVGAAMSAASAAVGAIGGGIGMRYAKKDFDKLDNLGQKKMDLTDRKQFYDERCQSLDLESSKLSDKSREHELKADTTRSKAQEADEEADVKHEEQVQLEKKQAKLLLKKDDLDKLDAQEMAKWKKEQAQLETDIRQKAREELQLRSKAEGLRKEAKDHERRAKELAGEARTFKLEADEVRLEGTKLGLETDLSKLGIDEKRLDMTVQKHGNYVRLLSVIAPGCTPIGQFAAAFPSLDAKSQTAYANYISSEMEMEQMHKGIEDDLVQKFREFVNQAIQFQKAIDESINQTMSNIAHNV